MSGVCIIVSIPCVFDIFLDSERSERRTGFTIIRRKTDRFRYRKCIFSAPYNANCAACFRSTLCCSLKQYFPLKNYLNR